jgi:cation transport regulator ChaB
MPVEAEGLPSTIARSPDKVQRTYAEALDNAHREYPGDEERAHRTAWAAVKHIAEKKGDHWELKDEPGPSDPQAARGGREAHDRPRETYGGVNVKAEGRAVGRGARPPLRPRGGAGAKKRALNGL